MKTLIWPIEKGKGATQNVKFFPDNREFGPDIRNLANRNLSIFNKRRWQKDANLEDVYEGRGGRESKT